MKKVLDERHSVSVQNDLHALSLPDTATLFDCVSRIKDSRAGLVVFTGSMGRFVGILTLGDIIRLVAARHELDLPVTEAVNRAPVTIPVATDPETIVDILLERGLAAAPLVDDEGRLIAVATIPKYLRGPLICARAVIMAGGEGIRLRPLTASIPKPMLPLGGKPILERIIDSLKRQGLRDIVISVRYLKEQIISHFGDGARLGVRISYIEEESPLGTCGALSQLPPSTEPTLLMNGDLLTDHDFRKMIKFHNDNQADMTLAVKDHRFPIPYGIVKMEMNRVSGIEEKPELVSYINGGIYVLSPRAVALIPVGVPCDATALIANGLTKQLLVLGYHMQGSWIDIGASGDYYRARNLFDGEETA